MGMAASQARYLGLTARKTNVEYEGQQVNQARTALANQSADTFNDLLSLEVPTAPSTQDFTTTQYSFEDGTVGETISNMETLSNDPDGYNYLVTHYHFADVYTGIQNKKQNPQVYVTDRIDKNKVESNDVQVDGGIYSVNGKECKAYDETNTEEKTMYDLMANSFEDVKNADPANVMVYRDAGNNIHIVLADQIQGAASGTSDAADYSVKFGQVHQGVINANTFVKNADGTYTANGYACSKYDETNEEIKNAYYKAVAQNPALATAGTDNVYTYIDENDGIHFVTANDMDSVIAGTGEGNDYGVSYGAPIYLGNIKLDVYDEGDSEQVEAYKQIVKDWQDTTFASSNSTIYTWEANGQRYFVCKEDLMTTFENAPDPSLPTENQPTLNFYSAQNVSTKIENKEKAFVDMTDDGRAESIRFESSSVTRVLKTETITDEAAYEDAMNQYNYNQQVYEKKLADINAKTKEIQEQDRTLELRLRQLDTEQEALQTEMEAVKKVIEKNIESTFKTFQ